MSHYMQDLDVYQLRYTNKTLLNWTGNVKIGYLREHEKDPELEHCPVESEPFTIDIEGVTLTVTVTVDLGWAYHGSMGMICIKVKPEEGSKSGQQKEPKKDLKRKHLVVFKVRYGLPDPIRPRDIRGNPPGDPKDTQSGLYEGDNYTRTQFLFLTPETDEAKTVIYDFRGDSMTISTGLKHCDQPDCIQCY